ncbi:MAG: hypothetical protein ACE361_26875 [Aureliella sp.]
MRYPKGHFPLIRLILFAAMALAGGPVVAVEAPTAQKTEDAEASLPADVEGYESRILNGWPVRVSRILQRDRPEETDNALKLLSLQIDQIYEVVPKSAIEQLGKVTVWLSPPYDGFRPTGEYHPGKGWLVRNGRPGELHQCIEFTNTAVFAKEVRRMPSLLLHEYAHAYHDQILGYDNPKVAAAYESAKRNGLYDSVLRHNGRLERAYAMSNPMEYFAELTEALLGRNDFFPFDRAQLVRHDAAGYQMLKAAWGISENESKAAHQQYSVMPPPASLKLSPFYKKYVSASGYPVVSSGKVNDYALLEAAYLIDMMLAQRPDVRKAMIDSGSRMIVMGYSEWTTDIPEYKRLSPKDYWDARARGLGGSRTDPVCSSAEENLLAYPGDPYSAENILIHEFAHNIHLRGMVNIDPTFDDRLKQAYDRAMQQGLWKNKYAATNHAEYFAEGVQSWFNNNRPPDHDHNHVDTRSELLEYDPGLAAICEEVFGSTELEYTKPATRLKGHLYGFQPSTSPTFRWPARLRDSKKRILEEAQSRGRSKDSSSK